MVEIKKFLKLPEKKYAVEIGLSKFINKLFPEARGTEIPGIVSQLPVDIYPLCQPSKDGLTKELIVKGSTIKRLLLGDPPGYWDISRIYKQIDTSQLSEEANNLLERFAVGPRDIDFRYQLGAERQDEDVRQALVNSLSRQGFRQDEENVFLLKNPGKSYRAVIEQTEIGRTNGPPRLFFNVLLYVDDKFLLRADFGRLADLTQIDSNYNGQIHDDFRVSPYLPIEEIDSYARVAVDKNRVTLGMKNYLIKSFNNPWSVKLFYFTDKLSLGLLGMLKGIGFRTFWPQLKGSGNYDFNNIVSLFEAAEYQNTLPWVHCDYDANLEKRRMEYISEFLLYLTYDPFLSLPLMAYSNLLPLIPLGNFIKDEDDLSSIRYLMAREIGPVANPDDVEIDANLHPEKYSRLYKEKVLKQTDDICDTGPFMLIRAINTLLRQDGREERIRQSLESLIYLFDPNYSDLIKTWFTEHRLPTAAAKATFDVVGKRVGNSHTPEVG